MMLWYFLKIRHGWDQVAIYQKTQAATPHQLQAKSSKYKPKDSKYNQEILIQAKRTLDGVIRVQEVVDQMQYD